MGTGKLLPVFYRDVRQRRGGRQRRDAEQPERRALLDRTNLPSRSWFLDAIRGVRHDCMLSRCAKMDRPMRRAKRHGMLKKGTSAFARLATLHCVSDGHSIRMAGLQRSSRICFLRSPARALRPTGRAELKNALLLFCDLNPFVARDLPDLKFGRGQVSVLGQCQVAGCT